VWGSSEVVSTQPHLEAITDLARDRRLVTAELHMQNAYYGHATVLKTFAGIPHWRPLKVAIEHGVAVVSQVWTVDAETAMPVFLCASEERARTYSALFPGTEAVAIGPMIEYAAPLGDPSPVGGRLVAFPAHSTHHIIARWDPTVFVKQLLHECSRWGEVVVCLYWRDILAGRHQPFEASGFRCVTAGHMYDPAFLPRLRTIIESGEAVITNEVGSHVLYSVYLQRPVRIVAQDIRYEAAPEVLERDGATSRHWQEEPIRTIRELFESDSYTLTQQQTDFVSALTGRSSRRSRSDMKEILMRAEERYRHRHPRWQRTYHWLRAEARREVARLTERRPRALGR
jgi:hypothetical protein